MLSQIVSHLIRTYQITLSPLFHLFFGPSYGCRFQPSCSQYSSEVFQHHGIFQGSWFVIQRLSRCHPFTEAGYDPVPHAIAKPYSNPNIDQGR